MTNEEIEVDRKILLNQAVWLLQDMRNRFPGLWDRKTYVNTKDVVGYLQENINANEGIKRLGENTWT